MIPSLNDDKTQSAGTATNLCKLGFKERDSGSANCHREEQEGAEYVQAAGSIFTCGPAFQRATSLQKAEWSMEQTRSKRYERGLVALLAADVAGSMEEAREAQRLAKEGRGSVP
jgi:hypothetical protein